MPFTQRLIVDISPFVLGIIMVFIPAVVCICGILLMRRYIHHQRLKVHNDIADPLFSAIGAVYAVLLAFVVVVTWENFDRSNLNVEKEANYLADLYTDAETFSDTARLEIRALLKDYAKSIVDDEWKMLSRGEASPIVEAKLKQIWKFYSGYVIQNETDKIFFQESVTKLNDLSELRRTRLVDARTGINPLLWFVLITCGCIIVIFSVFFGTENLGPQLIMSALLTVVIGLILFTILQLDFPFSGAVSIRPEAFSRILHSL